MLKGLILLCNKCTRQWNLRVFFGKWLKCKRDSFDECVFLEILLSQAGLLFLGLSSVVGSIAATFVFLSVCVCFCLPTSLPVSLSVSACLPACLFVCLSVRLSVCLSNTSLSQEPLSFFTYLQRSAMVKY